MAWHRPAWTGVMRAVAWLLLLALLPWWLGLSLLIALAAAALFLQHRLAERHARLIRHSLSWGLAGWLLALLRELGGGVFGLGAALLGALAGYTLLAGLDAWLQRDARRDCAKAPSADWPELARKPIGPPAEVIVLQQPAWHAIGGELRDPLGGGVQCGGEGCQFDDGSWLEAPHHAAGGFAQAGFSPEGRWFVASTADQHALVLWDRARDRRCRLRGWRLAGWHREQPWLQRCDDDMPMALHAVLGDDGEDSADRGGNLTANPL
ncbi:MAG: hypothetical protein ABI386_12605 [Rhodanobacter sp.]